MGGGTACKCAESRKPIGDRRWGVKYRNCNHSAANGYQRGVSVYSGVVCLSCRKNWRTAAGYVKKLKDAVYINGDWIIEA